MNEKKWKIPVRKHNEKNALERSENHIEYVDTAETHRAFWGNRDNVCNGFALDLQSSHNSHGRSIGPTPNGTFKGLLEHLPSLVNAEARIF